MKFDGLIQYSNFRPLRDIVQDDNENVAEKSNFRFEHFAWPPFSHPSRKSNVLLCQIVLYSFRTAFSLISLSHLRILFSQRSGNLSNMLIATRYTKVYWIVRRERSSRVKRGCVSSILKKGRNASRIKSDSNLVYDSQKSSTNVLHSTQPFMTIVLLKRRSSNRSRHRLQSIET